MRTFLCAGALLLLLSGCGTTDHIDRIPPEVSVVEPESDEIGAPIVVSVTATDNDTVSAVSFYIDGVFLERKTAPPFTFVWYSDFWGDGKNHLLSANALDPTGNIGMSRPVSVNVLKMTKPQVELLTPQHNAVVDDSLVHLSWKPLPNATAYTVQITDTTTTDLLIVDQKTAVTSMTVNLPKERTYRWRVLPNVIGNLFGGWSKENAFHRTGQFTSIVGTKKFDALNAVAALPDGGTVVAGSTHALERGGILVRFDRNGNVVWNKYFAGLELSWFTAVIPTSDGGFLAAGQSSSKEFPADQWFVKTDSAGELLWTKTLVHEKAQGVNDLQQTADGGYLVCSYAESDTNGTDIHLTKYDASFDVLWEKRIGGRFHDEAYRVTLTSDGGILLSGVSQKGTDMASDRATLIRLNFLGEEKWRRDLRSAGGSRFAGAVEHRGRYYAAGTSRSLNNLQDVLVSAFDSAGTNLWTKTFGGLRDDQATGIAAVNGRIGICGSTTADTSDMQDALLLVLDKDGQRLDSCTYGGSNFDGATAIAAVNGGFAITGTTTSYSSGSSDGFLILTDEKGKVLRRRP